MRRGEHNWEVDFPIREEVEDHAGRTRSFVISCHAGGLGFTVRAEEEGGPLRLWKTNAHGRGTASRVRTSPGGFLELGSVATGLGHRHRDAVGGEGELRTPAPLGGEGGDRRFGPLGHRLDEAGVVVVAGTARV